MEGVTGYRCHTLADWVEAIKLSQRLDRRQIATLARAKYSREAVGRQYDWVFKQLRDLSGRGWYADKSRKFADPAEPLHVPAKRQPRIWLYMPYFGVLPNYFQLYLDSLGRNIEYLSVFLITDIDLSPFKLPSNLIVITETLPALRSKIATFLEEEFRLTIFADSMVRQPYKLVDFKVVFPRLFADIGLRHGASEADFVGWGDCDLIFGKFADFLDFDEEYDVIGGFHGHLTALRNVESLTTLYRSIESLPEYLVDENIHIIDEIAFRKPLLEFLEKNNNKMFYSNRHFCDIIPKQFFYLFRGTADQKGDDFFESYHPSKDIAFVRCETDGNLTVRYEDGTSRPILYCHLQKRAMTLSLVGDKSSYYIKRDGFFSAEAKQRAAHATAETMVTPPSGAQPKPIVTSSTPARATPDEGAKSVPLAPTVRCQSRRSVGHSVRTGRSSWHDLCERVWGGIDPYRGFNAKRFRPDRQGWNSNHIYLEEAIANLEPRVAIEIGVWKGESVICMAEAMRSAKLDGTVLAVDTWLGSWDHYDHPDYFPSLLMQNGYPSLYYTFLTNVVDSGVTDYVLPLPLDSANAAIVLARKCISAQVIHIDAAHDYESIMNDLRRWWPVLDSGGVMIIDDYDASGGYWPSVRDAVHTFLQHTPHEEFEALPYKARFRKPTA